MDTELLNDLEGLVWGLRDGALGLPDHTIHDSEIVFRAIERIKSLTAELDAARYAPGEWLCPTCGFALTRRTFFPETGGTEISSDLSRLLCPFEGTPMVRMTYDMALAVTKDVAIHKVRSIQWAEKRLDDFVAKCTCGAGEAVKPTNEPEKD